MFAKQYSEVFKGDAQWPRSGSAGIAMLWNDSSTYIKRAPYFDHMVDPKTYVKD